MTDPIQAFFDSLDQRPYHQVITLDLLNRLPDSELEVALYDIVWAWADKTQSSWKDCLRMLDTMPEGYRAVYCTMGLEGEVSNGGFNQFFYNDIRILLDPALAGYRRMGLEDVARLVEGAAALYQREAKSKKGRLLATGQLEDFLKSYKLSSLDAVDERFWSSKDVISAARIAYIRQHPQEFVGDFRRLYK